MINPEFTKNCWLEITTHRLYVTPVVIALVAGLIFISADDPVERGAYLERGFSIAAFLFACVGGAYHCALSMINEFSDHTWDQQRMSPMSPWTLTWGKLFGGASFMWYGALLSLFALFLVPVFFPPLLSAVQRIELSLMILCFAVFAQAGGLLMVVNAANSPDRLLRYRRNYGLGLALFVILVGGYVLAVLAEFRDLPAVQVWWLQDWPLLEFWLLVVAAFAAWATLGAYRVMREQMQFLNGRLPWLSFNLFLMLLVSGFLFERGEAINWLTVLRVSFSIGLILAYATMIAQPMPQANIRRLVRAISRRQWLDSWQNMPLWAVSLALVALLSVLDLLMPASPSPGFGIDREVQLFELWLFALRDAGIFIVFLVGKKQGRAVLTGFFYLILLYSVIPLLITQIGWDGVLGFFWPWYPGRFVLFPVIIEVVLLAVFIHRRWRAYLGRI